MKKLLMSLAVILLFPNSVFGEEKRQVFRLPIMIQCGETASTIDLLREKYKEDPIALGDGKVYTPQGKIVSGQMLLWTNQDPNLNRSFSITISIEKMSCLVMNGNNLDVYYAPYVQQNKI